MCGISGVIAPRGNAEAVARVMHERLAHRGPDGEGILSIEQAVLCHRRLSIIDLSPAGAQPMWDMHKKVCISYNGEIYNYRELREECQRRGAAFASTSDTEVILNLYLLDRETCFTRLEGMFALCLADSRTGESWLVRDPLGIKPLYWAETRAGIAFASELGAILASGVIPFEVSREALQAYVQMDFVPGPMSIVRGVRKLPGGMLVHVSPEGRATERRYTRVVDEATTPAATDAEDLDRFDAAIRRAVQRHLLADVPVGVFLSGGIDSSIVARVAQELTGGISTFSIGFDDPSFDESRWFDAAARAIGSEHHAETLTAGAMADLLPGIAETVSEPLADGSIFPTLLLSRFTRQHVKVALSGDGADELFAGYPTHRMIGAGRAAALLPPALRRIMAGVAHRVLPVSHANLSFDYRVKKFLEGAHRDAIVQNQQWLGSFQAGELPGILTDFDARAQERLDDAWHEPSRGTGDPLEAVMRTDRRFYLQDGVLVKVDRASMSHSLEVRVPMLDPEMVRFANGLPRDRKLRGGRSKWLLREWAGRHFPREITERPKKGFGAPLAQWFRGDLRALVHDTLSSESIARDGFFRPDAVERLLADHQRGRRDERKRIFNVLMFTLWHRRWAR